MSTPKSQSELEAHKDSALKAMEDYLSDLINSTDENLHSKADKISYWLEDYARFLDSETSFDVTKFPKYKRGQIVKVHLGFNIGSEEGGVHYAIVIENKSPVKAPTLNVIPLTSVKSSKDVSKIRGDLGEVYLGNELYRLLTTKVDTLQTSITNELASLNELISELKPGDSQIQTTKKRLEVLKKKLKLLTKAKKEISKMKIGSIALVRQITTVSKIRIYDPISPYGVLSDIKVSNETLDKIDNTIRQLFTKI
ncbi:type II toxin-antitoxin system PemK/MazF family toxin [Ruminococcus flavefaciens]|uniref:type II toxin-antitoxin system PemK/MazF family toxin n=1 Tax=Ruminococcus flavefaciens TaxID=1265 RepID=UPI0026EBC3AE|nr:type II toxin-antitoxin system PemK/MazF family toxin [Ruminococcus flavefaciens]